MSNSQPVYTTPTYMLCLSPWLPEPFLEKMIEYFRKQLYEKLYQLHIQVQHGQPGHHRDLSLESAGESVSSSGSIDAVTVWQDQAH